MHSTKVIADSNISYQTSGCALTNSDPLVTVDPRPSMSATAAIVTSEVSIAPTCAVEETDWPSFPVISSVVGVLRSVRASIHR